MAQIYIYPKGDLRKTNSQNPYIRDLEEALSINNSIVNKKLNKLGVLDFFRYIFKTDLYFLNWIEDINIRRFGSIQVLFFVLFTYLKKITGKKMIWVLHNKYSHYQDKNKRSDFLYNFLMIHSDRILTHSTEGLRLVKEKFPRESEKIRYFFHPVNPLFPLPQTESTVQYDLLIWGAIYPYKGVLGFLKFLKTQEPSFKILIIGECKDKAYKQELLKYISPATKFIDERLSHVEIAGFARQSRFILFTFQKESVLSSGSLVDSIRMQTPIIGPNTGAFRDLRKYSFIRLYDDFRDIRSIVESFNIDRCLIHREVLQFFAENNWNQFAQKLQPEIDSLFRKRVRQ